MIWAIKVEGNAKECDNIKRDIKAIGRKGVDWIRLSRDRVEWRAVVSSVMNICVSKEEGSFLAS